MNVAIIVDNQQMAQELRKILAPQHQVFPVGHSAIGQRFDKILVLASMADNFPRWFDSFSCCLNPGGEIIYG